MGLGHSFDKKVLSKSDVFWQSRALLFILRNNECVSVFDGFVPGKVFTYIKYFAVSLTSSVVSVAPHMLQAACWLRPLWRHLWVAQWC